LLLKQSIKVLLPLVPALVVYAFLCHQLDFTQDDAYISYRYVANFLNGDGLVYNVGERVEGFTNFGWVIYLIMWGALGASYIAASKITGFILGAGIIVLTFLMARLIFSKSHKWFSLLPVYLVGVNQSLAYWSPAGLETAAFAFLVMLSLYLYLKRSWGLIAALVLAVWVRPEGALLTGLLIITEAIVERRVPLFSLRCTVAAFLLSLPFAAFKLTYYGSIFPNPFYAKTGWDVGQLANGLEYTGRFFSHYGFYGAGFILSLLFIKKLPAAAKAVLWFALFYVVYIVLIGGDVLKVHRFFVPVFGMTAITTSLGLWLLVRKLKQKTRQMVLLFTAIPLLALTYLLPRAFVSEYQMLERAFTRKMSFLATRMKEADSSNFSVALPTIGIFGYKLLGHEIIDMLGLTDTTIARQAEEPIEGMQTTWKEQKHNSKYLLGKAPDYIVFSTGVKPSAPAERALLLYRQFVQSYRTIGWFYQASEGPKGMLQSAFKRVREIEGEIVPSYPVEYVQHYNRGLDCFVAGDHRKAIEYYDKALKASPQPYNLYLIQSKAFSHMMLGQHEIAMELMNRVTAEDSLIFEAHKNLYMYARLMGEEGKASIHRRWLKKLVPWYLPRLDSLVAQQLSSSGRGRR
jgi:arabinofuranosyltransferase